MGGVEMYGLSAASIAPGIILIGCYFAVAQEAQKLSLQPSFDCSKALTFVAQLICREASSDQKATDVEWKLAQLERILAERESILENATRVFDQKHAELRADLQSANGQITALKNALQQATFEKESASAASQALQISLNATSGRIADLQKANLEQERRRAQIEAVLADKERREASSDLERQALQEKVAHHAKVLVDKEAELSEIQYKARQLQLDRDRDWQLRNYFDVGLVIFLSALAVALAALRRRRQTDRLIRT